MYPLVGKARKRDDGDTLNILTYNAMLKCLADVGDVEAVNALLQEMNEIGPAPDAKCVHARCLAVLFR
jgi:pentatricopeptide repeat protein